MTDVLLVIPARFGSTRLPGKPLLDLCGKPLIVRVLERLETLEGATIIVATDDVRIAEAVAAAGGEAVITSGPCPTGLDRVAEVAKAREASIIVNVQGDEPFVEPAAVARLADVLRSEPGLEMATLACPLADAREWRDPNVVKVVRDVRGFALYFSRAPIPWPRQSDSGTGRQSIWVPDRQPDSAPGRQSVGVPRLALRHIGVYAYRSATLLELARTGPLALEEVEGLEQLRALCLGVPIRVLETKAGWVGVDTPEDLARARVLWHSRWACPE